MPIDYSKWDNIDCSSSEEEEEQASSTPHVTRLDAPSRVTRTADGQLVVEQQKTEESKVQQQQSRSRSQQQTKANHIENWVENGSQVKTASGLDLFWSQDRYSVTFRLALPSNDIPGKHIQVKLQGVHPYASRSIAVGNDKVASLKLITSNNNNTVLLEGDFPHAIHAAEDNVSEDNNTADWEIDRVVEAGKQVSYWVMTVQKATPMEGLVIWWKHPLKQFPEIEARQANPNNSAKAEAFQQAWDEAHRQFREKAKQKNEV